MSRYKKIGCVQHDCDECICAGNWRTIISESEPLLGRLFMKDGASHRFIGVLHADDDYYYCFLDMNGNLARCSCVVDIEQYGYILDKKESRHKQAIAIKYPHDRPQ